MYFIPMIFGFYLLLKLQKKWGLKILQLFLLLLLSS